MLGTYVPGSDLQACPLSNLDNNARVMPLDDCSWLLLPYPSDMEYRLAAAGDDGFSDTSSRSLRPLSPLVERVMWWPTARHDVFEVAHIVYGIYVVVGSRLSTTLMANDAIGADGTCDDLGGYGIVVWDVAFDLSKSTSTYH